MFLARVSLLSLSSLDQSRPVLARLLIRPDPLLSTGILLDMDHSHPPVYPYAYSGYTYAGPWLPHGPAQAGVSTSQRIFEEQQFHNRQETTVEVTKTDLLVV